MQQTDQKIDYVEFPAADFDAIQRFYEKAFRWSFTDYGPEYRSFTDEKIQGGRRFHFTDPRGNELAVWSDQ